MEPNKVITPQSSPAAQPAVYSEPSAPQPTASSPSRPNYDYLSASSHKNRRVKTSYVTFIAIIFAFAIFAAFILWAFGFYLREAKEITPPSSGY